MNRAYCRASLTQPQRRTVDSAEPLESLNFRQCSGTAGTVKVSRMPSISAHDNQCKAHTGRCTGPPAQRQAPRHKRRSRRHCASASASASCVCVLCVCVCARACARLCMRTCVVSEERARALARVHTRVVRTRAHARLGCQDSALPSRLQILGHNSCRGAVS